MAMNIEDFGIKTKNTGRGSFGEVMEINIQAIGIIINTYIRVKLLIKS